ncbi:MAG: M23 family metallopeptidase [Pseudomonadota bacterium]
MSEPNGPGLQLLGAREAILREQSERARRSARARALHLYRLLAVPPPAGTVGGRSVPLAAAVLRRDLEEARLLKGELDRVRAERASLDREAARRAVSSRAFAEPAAVPAGAFLSPVSGGVVRPFGVARDAATGAWLFRAAASLAARAGETVRCPADGRVVRVADSVAGGAAVVLAHDQDRWTTVISGLDSVAVAPGETVRRGESLGSSSRAGASPVRLETWRGRTPVDPASLLRAR